MSVLRRLALIAGILIAAAAQTTAAPQSAPPRAVPLDPSAAGRFAALALACVHQQYPNKISHHLRSDADVAAPQQLTPAFFGCYDWHSSVHGHWLLARLLRTYPQGEFAPAARAALELSLTERNLLAEANYLQGEGRASFERPYGLAWLLLLSSELRSWNDPDAQRWTRNLAPLEQAAAQHLRQWLPKLRYPIRIGEHNQTAFSFGLIWDWAQSAHDEAMLDLLRAKAAQFYAADVRCPLAYEPSGEDFLSPCLGEADFMRRVLPGRQFAAWLARFLPAIPRDRPVDWLPVGIVTDRSDPKLAHIDGLNLSRAWMLRGIASALPPHDARRGALLRTSQRHAAASLPAVTGEHYEGGHWLGTFAVYLLTRDMPQREGVTRSTK